jgi:hypothetical protein
MAARRILVDPIDVMLESFEHFDETNERMDFHPLKGQRDNQLIMAMAVLYSSLSSMNNVV